MKLKKIFAALAASAMAISMFGMTAFAAGTEGDTEVVEDTTVEDVTEAPVETEAVVEDAAEAENPTTGNAPIALAVIPVALAAAAIVAKKAK